MMLYLYDIKKPLTQEDIALVLPSRKKRAARYLKKDDQNRCLAGGVLMAHYLNLYSEDSLDYKENKKPIIKNSKQQFNLTHGGDYVILAVSQNEIGVDVERIKPYSDLVSQKCFTTDECHWLKNQKNDTAFYTLWTAKESIMKGSGAGFLMEPSSFSVLPITATPHKIKERTWCLNWLYLNGHVICTAVENQQENFNSLWYTKKK